MVERFGYSLDVGKSLESEEKNKKSSEETVEEEPLQTPTGEDLSADSVEKDILDDIKEDIEVTPETAEKEDQADEALEKSDDEDEPIIDKGSEEVYKEDIVEAQEKQSFSESQKPEVSVTKEEVSADKFPPIVDEESAQEEDVIDKKEELDEFEEPMPDKPEEEPAPEPEKPIEPEEEDVKEMVDESFKEENKSQETVTAKEVTSDDAKGFGWWKWGMGIAIILVLAIIVFKLGFVGVVDNNPTPVVPTDEEIDQELEDFFEDSGLLNEFEDIDTESKNAKEILKEIKEKEGENSFEEFEQEIKDVIEETPIEKIKDKNPDELLDLLKEGLN